MQQVFLLMQGVYLTTLIFTASVNIDWNFFKCHVAGQHISNLQLTLNITNCLE